MLKKLVVANESGKLINHHSRYNRMTVFVEPDTRKKFYALWKRIDLPTSVADKTYRITSSTAYRADLISYDFYDTPYLSWVICMVNDIKNPLDLEKGLYSGRLLTIPDLNVLMSLLAI